MLLAAVAAAAVLALLATAPGVAAQGTGPTACPLTSYTPGTDYFPVKSKPDAGAGFTINYKKYYKHVQADGQTYLLKMCNAPPIPDNDMKVFPVGTKVINIPVAVAATSSGNALDTLLALGFGGAVKYASPWGDDLVLPCAQAAKANGSWAEYTPSVRSDDYSVLFTAAPDAANPKTVTFKAPTLDGSPLQQAEWVKFMGAFFNAEAAADALYESIARAYACRKTQVAQVPTPKPVVAWIALADPDNKSKWTVNQGVFPRALIADAGATPLAAPVTVTSDKLLSTLASAHVVIDATPRRGKNVELIDWLKDLGANSLAEAPYPFAQGRQLYAVDRSRATNGQEEFPVARHQLAAFLLSDLVSILYPQAQGEGYLKRRFLRNMASDEGYSAPLDADKCSAASPLSADSPLRIVPANADECAAGTVAPYTGASTVIPGSDAKNSEGGKNTTPAAKSDNIGVIFAAIVLVLVVAGFIVFVAPGLARRYRERRNQQYMQEML
ncbi:hypothetical protein H9P43_008151 [Blastocladiella emersonii ATCC 22665]|nr:hypothetical protein H9P43_008151 [Blastocladiella emersonii ATCC 22665]